MPYGIAKKAGGDSKANDAKMERCVSDLTKQGKPKLTAILICKSSIQKSAKKK
jgi:hypothetical protein